MFTRIRNLVKFSAALVVAGSASVSNAEPQTDVVTPTAWVYYSNVTPTTISNRVADGYRIVDLEVEDDSPLRMSAVLVRNTGDYAKGWWWYYGATAANVNDLLNTNNARLIDVEPYNTVAGLRFAVVMIHNVGEDYASTRGWYYGHTASQLQNFLNAPNGRRIIDVQPYEYNGGTRYAYTFINNSGNHSSSWWLYYNVTTSYIADRLPGRRLIDLEENGNGRYTCIMVPSDGNSWWWYYNIPFSRIGELTSQNAARLIDIQRWVSNGQSRFAVLMRRNDNDLAISTNNGMRSRSDGDSGFLLREFNGVTHAGVKENSVFEPASLIKTFHAYHALRECRLGNASLNTTVWVPNGANTSCPEGVNTGFNDNLGDSVFDMMWSSSNPDTEAMRLEFGANAIEASAAAVSATNTELNHILGCLCGDPENETTLTDLYRIHDAVHDGWLGSFADEFYDSMARGLWNMGRGSFDCQQVLDQELAASSLSLSQRSDFEDLVFGADKGGSYTCGGGATAWRSRGGYMRVPFREGCEINERDYFFGAWVNDASSGANANEAVGFGYTNLFRDRVRAAIESWETAAACLGIADWNLDGIISIADMLAFLGDYFSGSRAADLNRNGVNEIADLLEFMAAYFEAI